MPTVDARGGFGVEKPARAHDRLLRTQAAVVLGSQWTREHSTTADCIHSLCDFLYAPFPAPRAFSRCCAAPSPSHNSGHSHNPASSSWSGTSAGHTD